MKNYRPLQLQNLGIALPSLRVHRLRLNHHMPEAVWTTHAHDHGQLLVYLTGRGRQQMGERTYDCRPGTVIHVPAGEAHAYSKQMQRAPMILVIDLDLEVTRATAHPCALLPAADAKEIYYQFAFTAPAGANVKRVQIEDVSEEAAAFPLIDDQAPKLTGNRWQGDSATVRAGDAHLAWALTIQTSMRVYRFTITDAAGTRTEMLHVVGYPDFIKTVLRKKWGESY